MSMDIASHYCLDVLEAGAIPTVRAWLPVLAVRMGNVAIRSPSE